MGEIFSNWWLQVLSTVVCFYVFGLIVGALCRIFYSGAGRAGHGVCVATGLIGTPIHELGHAFFCVVFRHKIVEMSLFQPNDEDGVLGYVNHAYNPKNIYHQVGNFFIGIGPILFGSAALLALMYALIPEVFASVTGDLFAWQTSFDSVKEAFLGSFDAIFAKENFSSGKFWLFLVLACLITLHMTLSPADVKGSVVGTVYILVLLFVMNFALYYLAYDIMLMVTEAIVGFGVTVACFLSIAVVFAAIMAGVGVILKMLIK